MIMLGQTTLPRDVPLPGRRAHRRGSMFIETAISLALAIIVMVAIAQLVAIVVRQRHEVNQARVASQATANIMERLIVLPWDELSDEGVRAFAVSDELAASLDEPQLSITVSKLDEPLPAKQIEVALSWRDQANRRVEPTRLVAWRHQALAGE